MPTSTYSDTLERLDDALVHSRRLLQRPGYRRRLRPALPADVDFTVLRVLRAVERFDDEAPTIGALAEALVVDPSTASRFVEQAATRDYLDRRRCDSDRRRTRVALTDVGRQLLAQATAARREVLADVTEGWPAADVESLAVLLDRLRDGFDRLEGEE